jgi:hypothetical protein
MKTVMKSVKCKAMPGNKAVCRSVPVILPSVLVPEIGCGYDDREYLGSILVTAQKKKKENPLLQTSRPVLWRRPRSVPRWVSGNSTRREKAGGTYI